MIELRNRYNNSTYLFTSNWCVSRLNGNTIEINMFADDSTVLQNLQQLWSAPKAFIYPVYAFSDHFLLARNLLR